MICRRLIQAEHQEHSRNFVQKLYEKRHIPRCIANIIKVNWTEWIDGINVGASLYM